jgi:hypothetical protein
MTELETIQAKFLSQVQDLAELTAEQIAELLRKHGIKGWPEDCTDCAVSQWVQQVIPDGWLCTTTRDRIMVENTASEGEYFQASTPPGVKQFIRLFDLGCYPDLVRTRAWPRTLVIHEEGAEHGTPSEN